MTSAQKSAVHRVKVWKACVGFTLVCAIFAGLRLAVETQRRRYLADWDKQNELTHKCWTAVGTYAQVVEQLAAGKSPPATLRLAPHCFAAAIPGSLIDPRYRGWQIILTFSPRPQTDFLSNDSEVLSEFKVLPPVDLPSEPTATWWAVEHARVGAFWIGGLAWATGLLLMLAARGVRRQIAPICIAAASMSIFAASLELDFGRDQIFHPFTHPPQSLVATRDPVRSAVANYPAWFDAGGAMAAVALLLWLIPARSKSARQCLRCGYDLTGNMSGTCPECGSETPMHVRQRRLAELAPAAERIEHLLEPFAATPSEPDEDLISPQILDFPETA